MRTLAILLLLSVLGGCGSAKTETGYTPHTLSMTDAQRRSLYASPFSPEAEGGGGKGGGTEFRPAGFGGPGGY